MTICACAKKNRHYPSLTIIGPYFTMVFNSMDFIMDLPQINSCDSILVVVDRFKKMVHFIPCNKSITGEKTTKLFLNHVFCYNGFPEDNVFYHELQFASKIWKQLFELLCVKVKLSSTFHPHINGQT